MCARMTTILTVHHPTKLPFVGAFEAQNVVAVDTINKTKGSTHYRIVSLHATESGLKLMPL